MSVYFGAELRTRNPQCARLPCVKIPVGDVASASLTWPSIVGVGVLARRRLLGKCSQSLMVSSGRHRVEALPVSSPNAAAAVCRFSPRSQATLAPTVGRAIAFVFLVHDRRLARYGVPDRPVFPLHDRRRRHDSRRRRRLLASPFAPSPSLAVRRRGLEVETGRHQNSMATSP